MEPPEGAKGRPVVNVIAGPLGRDGSMVTLMDDENAEYAHPVFWAPFSVVGEGGRVSID